MGAHRVLVIDDEEMIRDSLVEFLEECGYQAIGAVHGGDALDKLKSMNPLPCVILLDLMMPVVDGPTFRERQLNDPQLAGIPVIVLSAYRGVAQRAAELNVEDHLDKPLKLSALLELVQKHCPLDGE
jgi:CheY-like chemotaxis protein